jgi:hypothetical protein
MDVPEEITLPMPTMLYLESHGLLGEVQRVADEGGNRALIEWLDAHGLTWHPGGSDPVRALADALDELGAVVPPPASRAGGPNRKDRRRAARSARRVNRRRH